MNKLFIFLGYTFMGACLLTFFLIIALIGAVYTVLGWRMRKEIEPKVNV